LSLLHPAARAVALSLAVHGLLVLLLLLLPGELLRPNDRSLPISTCVFADDFACTLDGPPSPADAGEGPPLSIQVSDPPILADPPSAAGEHPSAAAERPNPRGSAAGTADGPEGGAGHGPSIFQVNGSGRSVVYVIDRSSSMGMSRALPAAKRELEASLGRLAEQVRFQVILYNRHAEPLRLQGRYELVPATAENKRAVAELLATLQAVGSTDHLEALRRALELQPEVIFWITDAAELTAAQIQAITRQNQGRTAIHAIELSRLPGGGAAGPLGQLARCNRGTYHCVPLKEAP
jgi:hypothetical protein